VFSLAAEVAASDSEPAKPGVASKITKVTVYSDRAIVAREATVPLTAEPTVHRFTQLPGWVDEGSVRAATSVGKIVDVSIERRFLARSSDEGFRKAEAAHQELLRKLQALDDELAVLDAQREHVGSIKAFSIEKLSKDGVTRDIKVSSYGEVIDFVSNVLRKTAEGKREVAAKRAALEPIVAASARKIEELSRLTKLEETTVLVTVHGTPAGADSARLTLSYATPGATWEPMHELRMSSSQSDAVDVTSFAVVTQTTGEDWNHAELSFSTQSSSDSERIPELEMLALGKTEERVESSTRASTSFHRAREKYLEQNEHWNRMNQAPSRKVHEVEQFSKTYTSNLEYFERVQSKTIEMFQGLQQRGTTAHFTGLDPTIVRSDGRSIRVRIGGGRIAAEPRIIAAPEESLNAALTLKMTNTGGQPLLPGSVARYRDGAFLGVTEIDFVAKGEPFSAFFSIADEVKLTRTLDRKNSSLVRKARNRMQLSWLTTAKNLSDRAQSLVLAERVPVSENTDIQVSNVRIVPTEKPDAQGIVRRTITLQPGEERTFNISYQVDYPSTLVFDVQRKKRLAPPAASPASPSRKRDFEDQIMHLEHDL
jgi:uncharacterized protein (TIGR02231 family)